MTDAVARIVLRNNYLVDAPIEITGFSMPEGREHALAPRRCNRNRRQAIAGQHAGPINPEWSKN